ncbi:hypothetical protein HNR23_004460 [Nocardiopsis mwathae]|uniref:Uncharacterized protein n=1 Tax=Nocardiopsis mwathae TaxID=1472723 RepID=A0A7W9YLJ3_9ACTN|nr:hypothetical protein [Nocardiopsis mwathae]MBB6174400.1 hypothetical protein [Nocardiopsis mwathae]
MRGLKATRVYGVLRRLKESGLVALTGKGHVGAGRGVVTPFKGRGKPERKKQPNREHARLRSPGERANAALKDGRVLRKRRCCPLHAGEIARAILVLQARETG